MTHRLTTARVVLAIVVVAITTCACDDDEDGTAIRIHDPGAFEASNGRSPGAPPDDTPIAELSDAQARAVCDALAAYGSAFANRNVAALCHDAALRVGVLAETSGLSAATGQRADALCAGFEQSCLDNPSLVTAAPALTIACPLQDLAAVASCTATVGDLERCINELQGVTLDNLERTSRLACAAVAADLELPQPGQASSGPACASLQAQCPGLALRVEPPSWPTP